ncbi:MAG: hypothetical protein JNN09_02075 [Alphaproteobacteria bacterium]|nr:hypothetical protein [Alphaproteobacteria bacterium]
MTNIEGVMMDLQMELKRTLTRPSPVKGEGGKRESPLPLRERIEVRGSEGVEIKKDEKHDK